MAELYVIGAGPAGISCAHALVNQGHSVTVLDAGVTLEPDRKQVVERLRRLDPAEWDIASLHALRQGTKATVSGIPVKRVYGSDFPYRDVERHMPIEADRVTTYTSFAKGGLSNVWGAAVLPYSASDIRDWPVSAAQLAPYYDAVFRFMPLAADRDDLEELFPLHSAGYQSWSASPQAEALLERLRRNRDHLKRRGFVFGKSRIAVQVGPRDGRRGCVYCAQCMRGCVYDLIYNASHTLDQLIHMDRIRYVKDVVVDEVHESAADVTILAHDRVTGRQLSFDADRVFVAAGVLPTARIMLESLKAAEATLTMRDSQYFLLPLLGLESARNSELSGFHTLAQIFLEIFDPTLGEYPVHLQLYTYNDLYAEAVKQVLRRAYPLFKRPANALLNRLMVIQGYLHSDASSTASISLRDGRLIVKGNVNPQAAATVRATVAKLRRNATALGVLPLTPLLKIGNPGQGMHVGGTFPMRERPGPLETDTMGRPYGLQRVHLVDASVLPSIPSTTIAVNAMANAYRIGSEWNRHGA